MGIFKIFNKLVKKDEELSDNPSIPMSENIVDYSCDKTTILSDKDIEFAIDYIAKQNAQDKFDAGYFMESEKRTVYDPLLRDAAYLLVETQQGSVSMIQRKFCIGYNRAGRIMDQLEHTGIVGKEIGSKPREVLCKRKEELNQILHNLDVRNSIISNKFENKYRDRINEKTECYLREIEKEEEENKRMLIELEKEEIKHKILERRKKRELNRIAMDELREEGIIEVAKKREPIPQEVQDAVWRRDGGRCVKCGSQENLEFDHIIPFSKGGSNTVRNLQLLCQKCNREKSNHIG